MDSIVKFANLNTERIGEFCECSVAFKTVRGTLVLMPLRNHCFATGSRICIWQIDLTQSECERENQKALSFISTQSND